MRPEITPDLLAYTKKFLQMHQLAWHVPKNPIRNYGVVTTIVLHRENRFQSELVISHPQSQPWPGEHHHPGIDSIEVELCNCKGLTRNGEPVEKPDVVFGGRYLVHLLPTDDHGSPDNSEGISLISCQHWDESLGEMTSVGASWAGQPVSDEHSNSLVDAKRDLGMIDIGPFKISGNSGEKLTIKQEMEENIKLSEELLNKFWPSGKLEGN